LSFLTCPIKMIIAKNFFISATLTSTHFNPLELLSSFVDVLGYLNSNDCFVHFSLGHANGTLNPVRRFGFSSYSLLPQNSVAWVSVIDSEWNTVACCVWTFSCYMTISQWQLWRFLSAEVSVHVG
jgi:hypothetical protein